MRDKIIKVLHDELITNSSVCAFWLEGADALNNVDQYSDIDVVLDVIDGHEGEVFRILEDKLSEFGELDVNKEVYVGHDKIRQKVFHIENTSEYLLIDCNIQSHSRKKSESSFEKGDNVEFAKIIFDKENVVSIVEPTFEVDKELIKSRISEFKTRYEQHSRVIKYVYRNNFLEALMYYNRYVADPLVELSRFIHTPKYHYLHMIHISNHLPKEEVIELESFYKISTLNDIELNVKRSIDKFNELVSKLNEIYNLEI